MLKLVSKHKKKAKSSNKKKTTLKINKNSRTLKPFMTGRRSKNQPYRKFNYVNLLANRSGLTLAVLCGYRNATSTISSLIKT